MTADARDSMTVVTQDINNFNTSTLNKAETQEKSILPDKDAIHLEKSEIQLREEIEKGADLKHVPPVVEKVNLPHPDDIKQEKTELQLREEIEKGTDLKHVKPEEKIILPDSQDIQQEKNRTSIKRRN